MFVWVLVSCQMGSRDFRFVVWFKLLEAHVVLVCLFPVVCYSMFFLLIVHALLFFFFVCFVFLPPAFLNGFFPSMLLVASQNHGQILLLLDLHQKLNM